MSTRTERDDTRARLISHEGVATARPRNDDFVAPGAPARPRKRRIWPRPNIRVTRCKVAVEC